MNTMPETISYLSEFSDAVIKAMHWSPSDQKLVGNYKVRKTYIDGSEVEDPNAIAVHFATRSVYVDQNSIVFVTGIGTKSEEVYHFSHNDTGAPVSPESTPAELSCGTIKTEQLAKSTAVWFRNELLPNHKPSSTSLVTAIRSELDKLLLDDGLADYVINEPDYAKQLGMDNNFDIVTTIVKLKPDNLLRGVQISNILTGPCKDIMTVIFISDGRESEAGDVVPDDRSPEVKQTYWYRPALILPLLESHASKYHMRDEANCKDEVVEWLVNGNLPK